MWEDKYIKKIADRVDKRGLVSYMNDTKWLRLMRIMNRLEFPPPYILKKVLDDTISIDDFIEDGYGIGLWTKEAMAWGYFVAIEWVKIRPRYKKHLGAFVDDEIIDIEEEFLLVLEKNNIRYEEYDNSYVIYGYK